MLTRAASRKKTKGRAAGRRIRTGFRDQVFVERVCRQGRKRGPNQSSVYRRAGYGLLPGHLQGPIGPESGSR